ncbi:hypothetical protein F5Y16DRAFT_138624 [Xylariaceae sp. FL0255]|nr:hypothetical protein F5Y16DRAFT_138624 [Xylariaceae sp. FL0255]
MDSQMSAVRGRGRSSTRKRHTFHSFSPPYTGPSMITAAGEPAEQLLASQTPSVNLATPSLSFNTPSPSAAKGTRNRARVTESGMSLSHDPDTKGGRSLRKRARVDYTFDQAEEEVSDGTKATPAGARALKKRRTDLAYNELETDEEFHARVKRRASEQPAPPASATRRRTQLRKTTLDPQPVISVQSTEDVEVQDTIEVGGHHSEMSDESTLRRTSTGSSNNDSKPSLLTASLDTFPTPPKPAAEPLVEEENKQVDDEDQLEQTNSSKTALEEALAQLHDESEPLRTSYEHLTPYIDGVYVEYPSAQPDAEAEEPNLTQEEPAEEMAEGDIDGVPTGSFSADAGQEDTPATDSLQPELALPDGLMEDTPIVTPEAETTANSPAVEPDFPQPALRKPIKFKKTRDASEFTSLFADYKSLSRDEKYERLAVVNRAMTAWQNEYNKLRELTDDEANAVRYRQEEAAFEHRFKMLTSKDPDANPIRKDFVVKGVRADKPDPEISYLRQQDKIMAANYFFDYDDRDSKIGNQDPLEQKAGPGKGRLRERPKQTLKAAEADDPNVVVGKRTRKAPALFDGTETVSRASTPAPPQQRRRRRVGQAAEENVEIVPSLPVPANPPVEQPTPRKKGKGGRPRKHPLPEPVPEQPPVPWTEPAVLPSDPPPPPEPVEEGRPTRKRRRRTEKAEAAEVPEVTEIPAPKRRRRVNSNTGEIPPEVFPTSSLRSSVSREEEPPRPNTASSTATQSTVASVPNSYQLREKRQKKFTLEPEEEGLDEEPKPKRVRRSKKTQVEDFAPVPEVSLKIEPPTMPSGLPATAIGKPTKIKIKNYKPPSAAAPPPPTSAPAPNPFSGPPSSTHSTPPYNGAPNGMTNGNDQADSEKDYSQMTKSEKMSHSMKARWASGSMSQAVAKRRVTLANKKQAVKEPDPGITPGGTTAPGQP